LAAETAMAMAMAAAIPVARLIAARAAPDRARKHHSCDLRPIR